MVLSTHLRAGVSALAAATALLASTAQAQSSDQDKAGDNAARSGELQDIVVTARFREEKLQDTPVAITAITAEDLTARSITNVDALGSAVPNAYIAPATAAAGATPTISLRGVFQSDYNYAFEPGVAIYIDDVYHGTLTGSSIELADIGSVEVLRGPQGTLFGKNTLGGAIRINSRLPEGKDGGSVEVGYGSYDRMEVKGSADLTVVPDKVFLRVSGIGRRDTGYQKLVDYTCDMFRKGTPELAGYGDGKGAGGVAVTPGSAADLAAAIPSRVINVTDIATTTSVAQQSQCLIGRAGGQELAAGRAMLRIVPDDRLDIMLTAEYSNNHKDVNPDSMIAIVNPVLQSETAPTDFFFGAVRDELLANYGLVYDSRFISSDPYVSYTGLGNPISDRTIGNTASVQSWTYSGRLTYDLTDDMQAKVIVARQGYNSQFTFQADASPFGFVLNDNYIEHRQTTAEVQLLGSLLDGKLDWTVGGFYLNGRTHLGGPIDYITLHFMQNDTYKDESTSGFAHGVFHLSDTVGLSAGVRYTHNTKTFTYDHVGSGFPALTQDAVTKRVDWSAGIDVKITPDLMVYGTISTGFRPRSVNPRPLTPSQFQPIPGENLISYELGTKGDYFDHRLRVNLSAFYSDYRSHLRSLNGFECVGSTQDVVFDPTECAPGSSPVTWFYYVGEKAKIYGLEGEITAEPVPGLTINGAFGLNKFESSGTGVAYFDPSNRIQPEFNASAGIQYEIPAPGGVLTPRLDWRYQTMMSYNPNPGAPSTALYEIPAYSVFDARLTYKMDNDWQASLAVTNLFDKFYYATKFGLTGFNVSGVPSRPREFMFSIKREF